MTPAFLALPWGENVPINTVSAVICDNGLKIKFNNHGSYTMMGKHSRKAPCT
jgi:hypothetical protein